MPKGKYKENGCNHDFIRFGNTMNYHCALCEERATWSLDAELAFLDRLVGDPKKPVNKKVTILEGYIKAVSSFPSGNFTHREDTELLKHAGYLILVLEKSVSCVT